MARPRPTEPVFLRGGAGADTLTGGGGNDTFNMGGELLTATDQIRGGSGYDTVTLNGDYSAGLALSATTLSSIENITLGGGNSYNITSNNADGRGRREPDG